MKKLHITPEDNDTSRSLLKQVDEKRAELAKLRGAEQGLCRSHRHHAQRLGRGVEADKSARLVLKKPGTLSIINGCHAVLQTNMPPRDFSRQFTKRL